MASALLAAAKPFLYPQSTKSPAVAPPSPRALATPQWSLSASSRSIAGHLTVRAQKWEPSKVVPQADRVLIRLEELPEKSAGGVLLPKSAVKFERYLMGEILSVGSDVSEVESGKKVLFSDINAYEVNLGSDGKHCFCRAGDLLAVVE